MKPLSMVLAMPRRIDMVRLKADGWTLQRIADKYGITRQRVHQIINRHNELTEEANGR